MQIILGQAFEIEGLAPSACTGANPSLDRADLLITAGDFVPTEALAQAAARLPVLRFESGPSARIQAKHSATIPLSFRPEQLRRRVNELLARPAGASAPPQSSFLEYPLIPRDVTAVVQRAAATRVAVLMSGEAGTGKGRVARAIHAAGSHGRFVSLTAARLTAQDLCEVAKASPGPITLYVADIALLDPTGQQFMVDLCENGGFESAAGWHDLRLVCATRRDILDLAADDEFDSELFYRLSVLPVTLPPLRQRTGDIGDIVTALARDLGGSFPHKPYAVTAEAVARMENYLWFGNLAELETVLLRTMALASGPEIDASDLRFDASSVRPYEEVSSPAGEPAAAKPESASAAADSAPTARVDADKPVEPPLPPPTIAPESVDLVIQELAHEFRNPMVTIKTLTQRLERLLEDKASRDQVTRMTGEAVDRMDRTLENLLQFTRFGEPMSESVPLSPLVTNCLSQLSSAFTERQVLLNYEPPDTDLVKVDSAQVGYALENLLRVVLRDLRDGDTLSIHPLNSHGISLEFPARGQLVAEKLAAMTDSPQADASLASIGFVFAKALVERNGGKIEIHPETGRTIIAVALPGQGDTSTDNGHASHSGRR